MEKNIKKNSKAFSRSDILIVITIIFTIVITFRLFDTQVIKHRYFLALASNQQTMHEELVPERGRIYIEDRFNKNLYPLAINKRLNLVYAIPKQIKDTDKVANALEEILEIPKEDILERISKKDDLYEPIKRRVADDKVEEIKNRELEGIRFQPEDWRFYPDGNFASHILGFVGYVGDEKRGRYGIEGYYNDLLSGKGGFLSTEKDPTGRFISIGDAIISRARDGDDLVLTLDRYIQFKAEQKLKEGVEKFGAEKGTVIVMNPNNGEIIALANYPNFDPNNYSEVEDMNVYSNSAVYDLYEPGSSFKPIIMTAALDLSLVSPDTTIVDNGAVEVDEFTIRNFDGQANGEVTMTEILEKSINVGMVKIGQKMGAKNMHNYIDKFGFNNLSGIDLDSEIPVNISDYRSWSDADQATITFGQGMVTTPMRLITATAAIANGGRLIQPRVVKKIIRANGDEEIIGIKEAGTVISSSVSATASAMMVSVIENGHASTAKVKGYKIAGKTGTAQVPNRDKPGYDPNKKIATFIGYGPVEDPQFIMLVKLDNPGGNVWGSTTAAPVFKEIASEILRYYQISPTE
jgi:cell division protein FtsI/penicillin-binding protein 2